MADALSLRKFSDLNNGLHNGERYSLPGGAANFFFTQHDRLAASDLAHYHDEPHVTLVLAGNVRDQRRSTESLITSGGLMFFRAGEIHRTIATTFPVTYMTLQLSSSLYLGRPKTEEFLADAVRQTCGMRLSMLAIYRELRCHDEYSGGAVDAILHDLIAPHEALPARRPRWLAQVEAILRESWNQEISVEEIAKLVGVHPKSISRAFPRYFRCTFGDYRRRLRLERAIKLITNRRRTLTEIATDCGFYDQSHFIRYFKASTGLTPTDYRRLVMRLP